MAFTTCDRLASLFNYVIKSMISGHVPLLYTDWFEPLNYYYHKSQVWSLVFK